MTINEYVQYRNATGTPGAAWVYLIQNSDEYKTLMSGSMQKSDPNYTKYAKLLYDDVESFFIALSNEINLSSDIYDILIFVMQMQEYCTPFVTKKVLSLLDDILSKMNHQKHVDIAFSMICNKFVVNMLLDEYMNANRNEKIHRLFFLINMYRTTDTFGKIPNLDDILQEYKNHLIKDRNFNENQVIVFMNNLNEIKRI